MFKSINDLHLADYTGVKYLEPFPIDISRRKKCSNACVIECDSVDYISITLYELTEEWVDVETGYIEIQANEPTTSVETIASYFLIDYFIYLISMPGAWIGVCVYFFLDQLILADKKSASVTTKTEIKGLEDLEKNASAWSLVLISLLEHQGKRSCLCARANT